jgi:hypothetical protein
VQVRFRITGTCNFRAAAVSAWTAGTGGARATAQYALVGGRLQHDGAETKS